MLKNIIKKSQKELLFIAFIGLFSLTPLYGLSYLAAIVYVSQKLTYTSILSTYASRYIFSFLLLCISIMVVATLSWLLHIPIIPLISLILFLFIHAILNYFQKGKKIAQIDLFSRDDLVSLGVALIAPIIILASFFVPTFATSASVQLLTRGYDNVAHLTIMRAVSDEKGYVYGSADEVKKKVIHGGGAYPQGWHTASTNIANGFGFQLFQSDHPTRAINSYLVISAMWYIITVFLFSRISLYLIRSQLKKFGSLDQYCTFTIANLLIQLMLFWGCIALGFSNFIACIAYLILLAIVLHDQNTKNIVKFSISALVLIAVSQIWLVPLPIVIGTILLFFYKHENILPAYLKANLRRVLLIIAISVTSLLISLFQVYIFLRFGDIAATDAINLEGGVFWISQILFGIIISLTTFFWITQDTKPQLKAVLSIMGPFFGMLLALFIYQLFTSDKTSYYFVKYLGLGLGFVGIYFVSAFTVTICKQRSFDKSLDMVMPMTVASIIIVALAIVGSGQTSISFNSLFQRYSIISTPTAKAIEDYFKSDHYANREQIVILRGKSYAEDYVGTHIANRVQHITDQCANNVSPTTAPIEVRVENLKTCADSEGKKLTVVTSDLSYKQVKSLNRDDLIIVNVTD